jgi:hypothetical protein
MSTRQEAKILLKKAFIANFNNTIPVAFENFDEFFFTTGVMTTKPSSSTWVRFVVQNNNTRQQSFASEGHRRFRRYGIVSCQVFIPSGTGTSVGDSLCEDIVDIFEGKRFSDVYCWGGTYSEMGIQEDGFYGFKVTIFFDVDDIK